MVSAGDPKSILKKPTYPATASQEDRNREVALYHALLLQHRKDVELDILSALETLIDYPLVTAPYDASNPSSSDAQQFKVLLRPFQPSDYDALIVERNINEKCGYTLCSNHRKTDGSGARFKLIGMHGKAKDFKVVERADIEKWCSEACARRALYVRVQLSESPAWERENYGADVDLLDEPTTTGDVVIDRISKINLNSDSSKKQDAANLALERGDTGSVSKIGLVDAAIKENEVKQAPEPPSLDDKYLEDRLGSMHLNMEGHEVKFGTARHRRHHGEEEDEEDTDWQL